MQSSLYFNWELLLFIVLDTRTCALATMFSENYTELQTFGSLRMVKCHHIKLPKWMFRSRCSVFSVWWLECEKSYWEGFNSVTRLMEYRIWNMLSCKLSIEHSYPYNDFYGKITKANCYFWEHRPNCLI